MTYAAKKQNFWTKKEHIFWWEITLKQSILCVPWFFVTDCQSDVTITRNHHHHQEQQLGAGSNNGDDIESLIKANEKLKEMNQKLQEQIIKLENKNMNEQKKHASTIVQFTERIAQLEQKSLIFKHTHTHTHNEQKFKKHTQKKEYENISCVCLQKMCVNM